MERKNKSKSANLLDFYPVRNEKVRWETRDNGLIVLLIDRTSPADRIAQKLFHKPKVTTVDLEEFGSFLWPLMDGTRTVEQLAQLQKEHFGDRAEPLYPRMVKYLNILSGNGLIQLKKETGKQ